VVTVFLTLVGFVLKSLSACGYAADADAADFVPEGRII
jgi:hypothetical protein